MIFPAKISGRVWVVAAMAALVFMCATAWRRLHRIDYVSALATESLAWDPASPSGYVGGQRRLIVPERNETSLHLILQTQQMLAANELRVRQVNYDNAPRGREVSLTSPYRWWLGSVAWLDHWLTGAPEGLAVERVARWIEPLGQALALLSLTWFAAFVFGPRAALGCAVGFVTFFPLGAGFLPGIPDHHGLAKILGLASVFLMLAGARAAGNTRWFAAAGWIGGAALWVDVSLATPILAGCGLGGMFALLLDARARAADTVEWGAAWRIWSLHGAGSVGIFSLIEFFPHQLASWQLESIHPVYGLAWLGLGEILFQLSRSHGWTASAWPIPKIMLVGLAGIGLAALPLAMRWSGSAGFLSRDLLTVRLTSEPGAAVAASTWAWLRTESFSLTSVAVLLPVLLLVPAVRMVSTGKFPLRERRLLALALGPVVVALGFSCRELSWWGVFDLLLLAPIAAGLAADSLPGRRSLAAWWLIGLGSCTAVGAVRNWPAGPINADLQLAPAEAQLLIERDLAHWLRLRSESAAPVVFAPPHASLTLSYYADLRAIGTFSHDNTAGFGASLSIAGANTLEEAFALMQAREVRFVILPSWDPFFDEFGQLYLASNFSNRKSRLVTDLRRWKVPPWLRPMAYPMPEIPGFEKQAVMVFAVVDEQSPVLAAARLADHLVELGEWDAASTVAETLRQYPGDLGALAARAQFQAAHDETAALSQTLAAIATRLASGGDRYLAWDRRVALAVVLARGGQLADAREQTRRCLAELSREKLASLSPDSLYGLLVLSQSFQLPIAAADLHAYALALLPTPLRAKL